MLDCLDKPTTGYDAHLHIRAAADLLPRLHAVARSRGLTAAAFARMAVMEAVTAAEHRNAAQVTLGTLRTAFCWLGGVIPYAVELAFLGVLWAATRHW